MYAASKAKQLMLNQIISRASRHLLPAAFALDIAVAAGTHASASPFET
jgi:hypothetical protein